MDRTQTFQEVRAILQKYAGARPPADAVTDATRITQDLDVDSARLVDIVLELEDKFGITISDEAMDNLRTVGDIVNLIESMTGKAQSVSA